MILKNFSRLVPCYASHPLIPYLPFNVYEFWNHISKQLCDLVCSSLVVGIFLHIQHVNRFYCHFVSKAFVTIDFEN